jgi:hypothetical protein
VDVPDSGCRRTSEAGSDPTLSETPAHAAGSWSDWAMGAGRFVAKGGLVSCSGEGVMAENEQSGFHEGVTIPVKPVGVGRRFIRM